MKVTWISQISKGNSYSAVSYKYLQLFSWFNTVDVSRDIPTVEFVQRVVGNTPDLIIVLHNDSNQQQIGNILNDNRELLNEVQNPRNSPRGSTQTLKTVQLAAFCPVDFTEDVILSDLSMYDFLITMNASSCTLLQRLYPDKQVFILAHLVEFSIDKSFSFLSCREKKEFSKRYMLSRLGISHNTDVYLVGICNANNTRKRHDLAIEAFRLFNSEIKNSHLIIKTTGQDSGPWVFRDWKGLIGDLPVTVIEDHLEEDILHVLYNSFDIMINCTDGEGFGLTPFEASLCDTFTILPWHSSFMALVPEEICVPCSAMLPSVYCRTTDNIRARLHGRDTMFNGLDSRFDSLIEVYRTSGDLALKKYVEGCLVGIVDPATICQRMIEYYKNPSILDEHLAILQGVVVDKFNTATISSQITDILMYCIEE
uniref:Glycosyl transferase family 1 domain-containing protein n=1 Tax=viral metagenome TaxID=1070528 RepID=A0A6C0JUT5_9ZZZZ